MHLTMLLEQYPCRCRVLASSNITTDHQEVLLWLEVVGERSHELQMNGKNVEYCRTLLQIF